MRKVNVDEVVDDVILLPAFFAVCLDRCCWWHDTAYSHTFVFEVCVFRSRWIGEPICRVGVANDC
jgi:hypothetical protein